MNYFLDPQNDLNKLSIVSTIKQKRDLGITLEEPGRATPCSAPKTLKNRSGELEQKSTFTQRNN